MDADHSGLEVLSRDECLRLLSGARTGRVGFHAGALPFVLPVTFAVDDLAIVVGVRVGSQLDDATRDAVVAFEADDIDPSEGTAWSVSVTGVTSDITDPTELAHVRSLGLGDWTGGATGRFIRISTDLISGRHGGIPGTARMADTKAVAPGAAAPAGWLKPIPASCSSWMTGRTSSRSLLISASWTSALAGLGWLRAGARWLSPAGLRPTCTWVSPTSVALAGPSAITLSSPEVSNSMAVVHGMPEAARLSLALGHTVVLDATWRHPRWRRAAVTLAEEVSADLIQL